MMGCALVMVIECRACIAYKCNKSPWREILDLYYDLIVFVVGKDLVKVWQWRLCTAYMHFV